VFLNKSETWKWKNWEISWSLSKNSTSEKNINEIYHNHLVKDFVGIEKIVSKYL